MERRTQGIQEDPTKHFMARTRSPAWVYFFEANTKEPCFFKACPRSMKKEEGWIHVESEFYGRDRIRDVAKN